MLSNQRADDPKQPPPEARNATRRPAHRRREGLGRPAVQDGVEHGLEEVFEREEAFVIRGGVDGGEEEDGGAHEAGGEAHGPLAAEGGDAVHEGAEEDAEDAGRVGVDVCSVGVGETNLGCAVLQGQDTGEIEACECQ